MFYEVVCKCGNIGNNFYTLTSLPVASKSEYQALLLAKQFPLLKKDCIDCVISIKQIDAQTFRSLRLQNELDINLCNNSCQQKQNLGFKNSFMRKDSFYKQDKSKIINLYQRKNRKSQNSFYAIEEINTI